MKLIHESPTPGDSNDPGYTSTCDISAAALSNELNKVYRQAVINVKITKEDAGFVNFDRNDPATGRVADGHLDISNNCHNPECEDIIARYPVKNGYGIFLVSNFNNWNVGGIARGFNRKYAFVQNGSVQDLAHELGHLLGLKHTGGAGNQNDPENLMSYGPYDPWRLRYHQWQVLQKLEKD